jgi:hypothetical protein
MKVYLLLDRSGSMSTIWNEAINSINTYANGIDKDASIHIAAFDSNSYDVLRDTRVGDFTDILPTEVSPRGMTPLYDAFGTIATEGEKVNDPTSIFVVMTDGHENCSKEYNQAQVKAKIASFETLRKWPVVFLGANFDVKRGYDAVYDANSRLSARNTKAATIVNDMHELAQASMGYAQTGDRSRLFAT